MKNIISIIIIAIVGAENFNYYFRGRRLNNRGQKIFCPNDGNLLPQQRQKLIK